MKVLMGTFVTESNANVPAKTRINHYDMAFGEDLSLIHISEPTRP